MDRLRNAHVKQRKRKLESKSQVQRMYEISLVDLIVSTLNFANPCHLPRKSFLWLNLVVVWKSTMERFFLSYLY